MRCTVYGIGSLGGVRSIRECLCLQVCTVLVSLGRCFDMDSRGNVPVCVSPQRVLAWTALVMHRLCLGPLAWARTLYLYTYGMDRLSDAPIVLRPECLGSHDVLVHVQFYGMDNLGNAPIMPARVSSHAVLIPVPHLAWTAWVMHRSRDGPRAWACTLYLYPYSIWHG